MVDDDKLATVVSIETNYFRALKVLKEEVQEQEDQDVRTLANGRGVNAKNTDNIDKDLHVI